MRCEDFSFTVRFIRESEQEACLTAYWEYLTEQKICLTAYWGNMRCEDFSFTVYQRIRAGSTQRFRGFIIAKTGITDDMTSKFHLYFSLYLSAYFITPSS